MDLTEVIMAQCFQTLDLEEEEGLVTEEAQELGLAIEEAQAEVPEVRAAGEDDLYNNLS